MAVTRPDAAVSPVGVPVPAGPWRSVARALRGSFVLGGRASRSEYWWFVLVASVVVSAVAWWELASGGSGWITVAVVLVLLPATLSLTVRRLHDGGYSGAWYFVQFLPFIGGVWLLVLLVQPTQRLPNRFGPGPHDPLLERGA